MGGTVTDTAANMVSMMSFLPDLGWAGCANHIIQLIVNVSTSLFLCLSLASSYIRNRCCTAALSPALSRLFFPLQGDILSMKEICSLLSYCKSLSTAYHSSINFARAIHEAQIEVVSCSYIMQPLFIYVFKVVLQLCLQVMGRRESEQPWSLLQEVSTRCDPFVLVLL